MNFAQLTQCESLRDIENCLDAVTRNSLAKANELRDWRIYADFDQMIVGIALPMNQSDTSFTLDVDNLVYAFDGSTISLCLKLCL